LSRREAKPPEADDDYGACYEAALHYIEYRPRSEAEVIRHLQFKRKFQAESLSRVVVKLKELKLIDDGVFSEQWARERVAHRHKSRLMIRRELMQKGVDAGTIESVTADIDDDANALMAGMARATLLRGLDYPEFYKRLASYLSRKGYGAELVHRVVRRLWDGKMGDMVGK
jgi:regulatory protein